MNRENIIQIKKEYDLAYGKAHETLRGVEASAIPLAGELIRNMTGKEFTGNEDQAMELVSRFTRNIYAFKDKGGLLSDSLDIRMDDKEISRMTARMVEGIIPKTDIDKEMGPPLMMYVVLELLEKMAGIQDCVYARTYPLEMEILGVMITSLYGLGLGELTAKARESNTVRKVPWRIERDRRLLSRWERLLPPSLKAERWSRNQSGIEPLVEELKPVMAAARKMGCADYSRLVYGVVDIVKLEFPYPTVVEGIARTAVDGMMTRPPLCIPSVPEVEGSFTLGATMSNMARLSEYTAKCTDERWKNIAMKTPTLLTGWRWTTAIPAVVDEDGGYAEGLGGLNNHNVALCTSCRVHIRVVGISKWPTDVIHTKVTMGAVFIVLMNKSTFRTLAPVFRRGYFVLPQPLEHQQCSIGPWGSANRGTLREVCLGNARERSEFQATKAYIHCRGSLNTDALGYGGATYWWPGLSELIERFRKYVDPALVARFRHDKAAEAMSDTMAEAAVSTGTVTRLGFQGYWDSLEGVCRLRVGKRLMPSERDAWLVDGEMKRNDPRPLSVRVCLDGLDDCGHLSLSGVRIHVVKASNGYIVEPKRDKLGRILLRHPLDIGDSLRGGWGMDKSGNITSIREATDAEKKCTPKYLSVWGDRNPCEYVVAPYTKDPSKNGVEEASVVWGAQPPAELDSGPAETEEEGFSIPTEVVEPEPEPEPEYENEPDEDEYENEPDEDEYENEPDEDEDYDDEEEDEEEAA
jgi:hypothetical protein